MREIVGVVYLVFAGGQGANVGGELDNAIGALLNGLRAKLIELFGDRRHSGLRMKQRRSEKDCGGSKKSALDRVHRIPFISELERLRLQQDYIVRHGI
jgi:hypothetical protein